MPTILSRKPGGSGGGGPPSGAAGGDLTGTYPNPTIAANAVDSAEIANNAVGSTEIANGAVGATELAAGVGMVQLFSSTLGADAASIDTGAAGVPAGYAHVVAHMLIRTTEAVAYSTALVRVNNNSGGNYDRQFLQGANAVAAANVGNAETSWIMSVAGADCLASTFAHIRLEIPFYTATNALKGGLLNFGMGGDTAGEMITGQLALTFRSTVAITRLSVTAGSGNLLAGSAMTIYGF